MTTTTLKIYSDKNTTLAESFGIEAKKPNGKDVLVCENLPLGEGTNVDFNPNYIFDRDVVKMVFTGIAMKDNILLWGDAGAGKTDLIEQIAARLNRQSFIISFGEETSMRQLIGGFTMSQGETPWRDGALLQAIRVKNALIGLDEINMAMPGVVAMLNHLLQKREIIIPETGETVSCAEGVVFIATSNTNMGIDESGLFEGSQTQNAATRSRFAGIHVKYLKEEDELRLIQKAYPTLGKMVPPIEGKNFDALTVQLANALRSALRDGGLSLPFSVRQVHRFINAVLALKDVQMAFKYAYWNLLDSVERQTAGDLFKTVFGLEITD